MPEGTITIADMKAAARAERDRLADELATKRAERDALQAEIRDLVAQHAEAERIDRMLNKD